MWLTRYYLTTQKASPDRFRHKSCRYCGVVLRKWTINLICRGVARGGQRPCPQSSIEWILFIFFYGRKLVCWDCSLYQKCSVGLKYAKKMRWRPCSAPEPLESSWRSPDSLVGWEGGRPLPNPHSPQRFRRLDSHAFGAQFLWPQCKILATPLLICIYNMKASIFWSHREAQLFGNRRSSGRDEDHK